MATTMEEISAAINLIDVKKQRLHKSFTHLQSQSPSSLNSTLNWPDFDSYFTSLRSSIHHKFNLLQTIHPSSDTKQIVARPALKALCRNSDGLGLMRFIAIPGKRLTLLPELPDAYRCSPDPAAMVLDAVIGFYRDNAVNCKTAEFRFCKKSCVIMLEGLLRAKVEVSIELKNRAMEIAVEWNRKRLTDKCDEKLQNTIEFLVLVGAYGLIDRFSMDELSDCFAIVTKRQRQVIELCRLMIPAININDLIQKLVSKDMHVPAVYYSIEFQKTDEFSPSRLLEERKVMAVKNIEEIRKKGEKLYQNEVALKEISELKSIITCTDVFKLDYPKESVADLVKELEMSKRAQLKNDKASIKQPATPTVLKTQPTPLKPKNQKANKFSKKPKVNKFFGAGIPTSTQNVMPLHQPNSQAPGLLPNHLGQYQNPLASSGPAGLYGLNIGYSGNPMPAGAGPGPSFYPTQSQPPSVYNPNSGYGYHPPYYPQ